MNTTQTAPQNNTTANATGTPRVLSSSSLVGTNVVNRGGESMGDIKDLMIDVRSGEVQYAVLSFGGFLGLGDKLFAVPLAAFDIDSDKERFVLDVAKDRLEKAPGFDKDNWPGTNDSGFVNDVHSYFGTQRRTRQPDPRLS